MSLRHRWATRAHLHRDDEPHHSGAMSPRHSCQAWRASLQNYTRQKWLCALRNPCRRWSSRSAYQRNQCSLRFVEDDRVAEGHGEEKLARVVFDFKRPFEPDIIAMVNSFAHHLPGTLDSELTRCMKIHQRGAVLIASDL